MQNKNKFLVRIIILVLLLINISNVLAVGSCRIEQTPQYINEYIKNVHKVVKNVNKIVSTKNKSISKKNSKFLRILAIENVNGSLNRLFTWEGYELDYEYSIQGSKGEIPKQLKRDINILKNESNNLRLANIEGAKTKILLSEICKGINNCNFDKNTEYTALGVIEKLKRSTNNIVHILINQAISNNIKDEGKIYFINVNLLLSDYSKENIKMCNLSENSSGEKGFFATIVDKIKNIDLLNKDSKNAMNDWNEAINLLWGSSDDLNYKNKERELLAQELQKQGIGGNSASAIMGNLDAFNNTKNGDFPFIQGKQGFFNSLGLQINEFDKALEDLFPGYKNGTPTNKSISAKDIENEINKLKQIQKNEISINSQYTKLKSLAFTEDTSNDILINRMIDMHVSISEMINTLNKSCRIAVKVCNSQKRGQGDCGQCN